MVEESSSGIHGVRARRVAVLAGVLEVDLQEVDDGPLRCGLNPHIPWVLGNEAARALCCGPQECTEDMQSPMNSAL